MTQSGVITIKPGEIAYFGQLYDPHEIDAVAQEARTAFENLAPTGKDEYSNYGRQRFPISENNPARILLSAAAAKVLQQGHAAITGSALLEPKVRDTGLLRKVARQKIMLSRLEIIDTMLVFEPGYHLGAHTDPSHDVRLLTNLGTEEEAVEYAKSWDPTNRDFHDFYPEETIQWAPECMLPPGHSYIVNNLTGNDKMTPHRIVAKAQRFMLMQSISGIPMETTLEVPCTDLKV